MPTEPLLIDIRNATIWRGTTRVFHGLTLSIAQHERVAILGPNGSGKTTLLKTINRELYPVVCGDSHVRILGRDHWNVWELRKHVGIVSHDLHNRYSRFDNACLFKSNLFKGVSQKFCMVVPDIGNH